MRTAATKLLKSVPPLPFSDNFNRANGAVGNGWTSYGSPSGLPAISSNAVSDGTVPSSGSHGWEISRALSSTPTYVQCDYSLTAGQTTAHLFCGTTDGGAYSSLTGISAAVTGSGTAYIFTWAAGVPALQTSNIGGGSSGTLKLEKSGTTYNLYVNGVLKVTWTGTASWGSKTGFIANNNSGFTASIDNFSTDGLT